MATSERRSSVVYRPDRGEPELPEYSFQVGDKAIFKRPSTREVLGRLENEALKCAIRNFGKGPFEVIEILPYVEDELWESGSTDEEGRQMLITVKEGFLPMRLCLAEGKEFTVPCHWLKPSLLIRFAKPQDAEIIHHFICELAAYEKALEEVKITPQTLREELEAEHPPFVCLIAEVEGQSVGFALAYRSFSTWTGKNLYVEDIFVMEEFRKKGIGKMFMQRFARLCSEHDFARLEWSTLDWNEPTITFNHSLVAVPLDEWTKWRLSGEALARLASR